MSKKTKWIVVALVALLALGIGARLLLPSDNRQASETSEGAAPAPGEAAQSGMGGAEGTMAPDFSLPKARGEGAIALSEYRGNVVLVNFWATWCPPCREEIPAFIQVRDKLHADGFEIIGVSLDEGGAGVVVPFAQEYGITYPLAMGDQSVTQRYGGIRGIPTSFLVDREGKIVQKYVGAIDAQTLENAVRTLL
jgi:cytochrome c biogenesis protein CcmG/thiol:disulfide interchange protein DsbE